MASIIPFPNKATHRRMPHLQNSPKPISPTVPADIPRVVQEHEDNNALLIHLPKDQDQSHLQITAGQTVGTQGLLLDNNRKSQDKRRSASDLLLEDNHDKGLKPADHHHTLATNSRPTSPLGSSHPSHASTLNSHDSKLIKNALYDAFGVLHHPSAHTKHSLSTTAAALRSGDVTPLKGSPQASPLLRPVHLRSSTPITPLELSDESSALGYFGLHSTTSATASPVLSGTSSNPMSPAHGKHHRQAHGSSHLSATYTSSDEVPDSGHWSPLSLSRRSSINPVEHPVLSSLQTLSITHPHPPEHYHPHLGHDLGHDKVPIVISPTQATQVAQVAQAVQEETLLPPQAQAQALEHSTIGTVPIDAAAKVPTTTAARAPQQQIFTNIRSSPFPMDQDGSIPRSHTQQDLV
ncbi:hypothetical protein BGZ83_010625 [Gryganskiella cystojenkinii]|nr:hypothetical protein BGZ83_010625 [Gryganskiella cystojenkinii]